MRKPGPITYLFGNPVTVLAALGATAFFGYQWWSNDGSLLPAVVAFLVMCQSMRSTDQLQKYNDWKREWEAMDGKSSAGAAHLRVAWTPATRFVVGILAWGIGAYGMLTVPIGDDFFASMAKVAFWSGSTLGVVVLMHRVLRLSRKPRAKSVTRPADPSVSLCLSPPRESPSLAAAFAALPSYCKQVIQ